MPKDFAAMLHPVKFYRRHREGGHFAAYERCVCACARIGGLGGLTRKGDP